MVGIVTPLKVNNYGTKLQAYAVQIKLSKMGVSSEIIVYDPRGDMRIQVLLEKLFSPQKIISRFKDYNSRRSLNKYELSEKIKMRNRAIDSLDKKCYITTPIIKGYKKLQSIGLKYDTVICGSDQVWNPNVIGPKYSSVEFVTGVKKIAFSPSFGVNEIPPKMYSRYKKFLDEFAYLSSREESGVKLIWDITGRTAELTADPTLTLSKSDWERFCENSVIDMPKEKYIFCYFLGDNSDHRNIVKKLKKMTRCMIVTMPHFKGYVDADRGFADVEYYNVNPADFVKLIANAEYICTDSFHGTVFSNIFQKEYFVFERYSSFDVNSTNSRLYSLLSMLDTKDRLIDKEEDIYKILNNAIDYSKVKKRMDTIRTRTDKYLIQALGIVNMDKDV